MIQIENEGEFQANGSTALGLLAQRQMEVG